MQPDNQNQSNNQIPPATQQPPATNQRPDMDYHDYSFITNPYQPPKKGLSALLGNGKKKMLLLIAAGTFMLLLLLVGYSLIFGSDDSAQRLLKLAQTHTELARVSEIGKEKARSSNVRNFATTTRLTLGSAENEIMAIVSRATKPNSKQLAAGRNADTDEQLTQAEQRNQFDEVYIELISQEIQAYRTQLEALYNETSSASNKKVYGSLYQDLGALLDSLNTD